MALAHAGASPRLGQGQGQCLDQEGDSVPTLSSRFDPGRYQLMLDTESGSGGQPVDGQVHVSKHGGLPVPMFGEGSRDYPACAQVLRTENMQSNQTQGKVTSNPSCLRLSPGQVEGP